MRTKIVLLLLILLAITVIIGRYTPEINQLLNKKTIFTQLFNDPISDSRESSFRSPYKTQPLEYLYVTIMEKDPVYGYTFDDLNKLNQVISQSQEPQMSILLQTGTENGPDLLETEKNTNSHPSISNATIEIRGNTTRNSEQKSYKIRIMDQNNSIWNNQLTINLNKHPYDYIHVRNKLSFDYMKLIPDLTSLETQFVRVFIKDQTSNPNDQDYIDYGLFTHVEQLNKRHLENKGMDPDAYLYKAINFEFYTYPEAFRERDDPFYDKTAFEKHLSIRGREYHAKLIDMLEDVNNPSLSIESYFDKHFNRDNFLTFIGVNILMGNLDTSSNNFFIYSSVYSEQWYFLPWDYDGAWDYHYAWGRNGLSVHPYREGLSLYLGWPLARKFFQDPKNVNALSEKIESLSKIITEERTKDFLESYYPIVKPLLMSEPDVVRLPRNIESFDENYYSIVSLPTNNRERYYRNLAKPAPIFIGDPWIEGGKITFNWTESFDMQNDEIFYDFKVSKSPDFSSIYMEVTNLTRLDIVSDIMPPGEYFWTVTIRDINGNEQIPFETYMDSGKYYHGVKRFIVE